MSRDGHATRSEPDWLRTALAALDAANALDPNHTVVQGKSLPKELAYAQRASEWLAELVPDASPALRLATRAHHLERWCRPRDAYPKNRPGYLRWRKDAGRFHAERMTVIAKESGVPAETIDRAAALIRKARPLTPAHRAESQAFEDALCLVFVEQQLSEFAQTVTEEKLRSILAKTLPKMSAAAITRAAALPMQPDHRKLLLDLASQNG